MIDPITALGADGTALKIIDSVAGQWDRFFKKKEEAKTEHRVKTQQETVETIVVLSHGQPVERITAADLAKLDSNSRALIKALEESMQRQFDLWVLVYPQRDVSVDPVTNAKIDRQLTDIAKKMCSDMEKLFKYLDQLGKYLEDHYSHVRYICSDVAAGRAPGM
jgi:hypothetical protein